MAYLEAPPLSHYAMKANRPGIIFGFSAFDHQITRAFLQASGSILRNISKPN